VVAMASGRLRGAKSNSSGQARVGRGSHGWTLVELTGVCHARMRDRAWGGGRERRRSSLAVGSR